MKKFLVTLILLLSLGAIGAWAEENSGFDAQKWAPEAAWAQAWATGVERINAGAVPDGQLTEAALFWGNEYGDPEPTPEMVEAVVAFINQHNGEDVLFTFTGTADGGNFEIQYAGPSEEEESDHSKVLNDALEVGRARRLEAEVRERSGVRTTSLLARMIIPRELGEEVARKRGVTVAVVRLPDYQGQLNDHEGRISALEKRPIPAAHVSCEGHRPGSSWSIGIGAGALYASAGTEYQIPCFTGHAVVRWGEDNKWGLGAVVHYGFDGEQDQQDWAKRAALEAYIRWFKIGVAYGRYEIIDPSEHFYWASEGWSAGVGIDLRTGPLGNAPFSPGLGLSGSIYGGTFYCQDRTGLVEDEFKEFGWTGEGRVYVEFFPGRW